MKKKSLFLALTLVAAMALSACSAIPGMGETKTDFEVGEKVKTYWFDYTVNSVETMASYGDYTPETGYQLAVCDVTMKNTVEEGIPMYQSDFALVWFLSQVDSAANSSDVDGAYPLDSFSDEQLPNEYTLEKGESKQGLLIFEVPVDVKEADIMFQEYYSEGDSDTSSEYMEGDTFWVRVDLG